MTLFNFFPPSPIQKMDIELFRQQELQLWVKRDDLIHPEISGNKWRKLKHNLEAAKAEGKKGILTFGGAFSNHIYALAAAGKIFDLETIGIIRGERIEPLNATLRFATDCGMKLIFTSRTAYRNRESLTAYYQSKYPEFLILPEGGTNLLALRGCAEMIDEIEEQWEGALPDYLCASCGTGGTLAGMITGMKGRQQVIGFSALKGDFHQKDINDLLGLNKTEKYSNWSIQTDFHFGGYARHNSELIEFINHIRKTYGLPLEPIYTGKLFYGLFELAKGGFFSKGSKIMALHSGGLQGIQGFNERYGPLLKEGKLSD